MARKRSTPPRQLSHHWYLAEWAEVLEKSQADAVRELGWVRGRFHTVNSHVNSQYPATVKTYCEKNPSNVVRGFHSGSQPARKTPRIPKSKFTVPAESTKATASALWNGKQRYTQDLVDEVSAWFNIRPYELLMHPAEAMSLRQVRESAARIATIQGVPTERTGTAG
jgi:hypothetical protein